MDKKYVVFKAEEFSKWYQTVESKGGEVPMALDDAVVIRRQDVFAPPALDAYSNAILTTVEIIRADGGPIGRAENLEKIATYFHEQAALSWDTNRKLPD